MERDPSFRTAHAHLNPGGVLIATPDATLETFEQNKTTVAQASREGLDVVFVENLHDPDSNDGQYDATILYLIRESGKLLIETDHWTLGLFPLETWRSVLRGTGFEVNEGIYQPGEGSYTVFACVKTTGAEEFVAEKSMG